MSSHATTPDFTPDMARLGANKQKLRRAGIALAAPVVIYALVRPLVSSDALGLGIAGALPILYSVGIAFTSRRIDPVALVSGLGFALACLVSALTGGSSLPMKVDEALITFILGLILLVAVLIRRPLPIGRLLRIPNATSHTNGVLGAMVGAFLMLHALVHVMLAVSLPTSTYLTTSRVVDWGTIALGIAGLHAYARRVRAAQSE
jgi:hypothetical protein